MMITSRSETLSAAARGHRVPGAPGRVASGRGRQSCPASGRGSGTPGRRTGGRGLAVPLPPGKLGWARGSLRLATLRPRPPREERAATMRFEV